MNSVCFVLLRTISTHKLKRAAGTLLPAAFLSATLQAASPGLPFKEDFADTALRDPALTTAHWDTDSEQLLLAAWRRQYGAFEGEAGTAVGSAQSTPALALGDVDGDGDLDLVEGNINQANRLFLNNGTADPFNGVAGSAFGSVQATQALQLGDVDGDGDLDLLEGNTGNQATLLYLNNGSADPFNGVTGSAVGSGRDTSSLALGDLDGDGDLDLLQGNVSQASRLFLNNGSAAPFSGVSPITVTASQATTAVVLGDLDGDGDLDLVQGNASNQANLRYLNNGTANPFDGVSGVAVGTGQSTFALALADLDGDSDLDLLEGNGSNQANRLFLNNGTADPFNGVAGTAVGTGQSTTALALGDVDGDGDFDLLEGNTNQANRLFLNNATNDPYN
jgi:hypothetical protein